MHALEKNKTFQLALPLICFQFLTKVTSKHTTTHVFAQISICSLIVCRMSSGSANSALLDHQIPLNPARTARRKPTRTQSHTHIDDYIEFNLCLFFLRDFHIFHRKLQQTIGIFFSEER